MDLVLKNTMLFTIQTIQFKFVTGSTTMIKKWDNNVHEKKGNRQYLYGVCVCAFGRGGSRMRHQVVR